jgi:hypothetical protein
MGLVIYRLAVRLLVITASALAVKPAWSQPQPARGWPSEQLQLPFAEPAVHALAYDLGRQVLWLGTPNEIGVFDGREARWPKVPAPDVIIPGAIVVVPEGVLVGTRFGNNSTVWLYDEQGWTPLVDTISGSSFVLARDAHGGVWIGNSRFGPDSALRYYRGGRVSFVERGERLNQITAATMDNSGRLWLIMYGSVHAFLTKDGALLDQIRVPPAPSGLRPNALEVLPNGTVLVAHSRGVMALTPNGWCPLPVDALDLGAVFAVKVDRNQRVWVAGERGLAFEDAGTFFRAAGPRVIGSEGWPPVLEVDALGELWVGSSAGLWRLRLEVEHRALPGRFSQLRATDGALWAYGEPGLLRIDRKSGQMSWAARAAAPGAIDSSQDGSTLWGVLSTGADTAGGLYRFTATSRERVADPPLGRIGDIKRVRSHPDGRAVSVTYTWGYEFSSWRDDRWETQRVDAPGVQGGTAIADLSFDREGRLWAVLPNRIGCRDGVRWIVSGVVAPIRPVKLNLHGAAVPHPEGGMVIYGPWRHLVHAFLKDDRIVVTPLTEEGLQARVPEQPPQLLHDGSELWMVVGGQLFRRADNRIWTVDRAIESWFPELQVIVKTEGRLFGLSRFDDPAQTGPTTLVSLPWEEAPTPILETAQGSELNADAKRPFFDAHYISRAWWWHPASLSYRIRTQPAIAGFQEWTREPSVSFTDQPHGLHRTIDVEAFDPLGRASTPLRFVRQVTLPVKERPWFLPVAVGSAVALVVPIVVGLTVLTRRWRAHGYRNDELWLGSDERDQLADLRREIVALGERPPLGSLQQIGLRLGALLPDSVWRQDTSRWRRDRRLRLRGRSADDAWMLTLPWETATRSNAKQFLGQMGNVTILRCAHPSREAVPRPSRPRLLHLVASPVDMPSLGASDEFVAIRAALPSFEIVSLAGSSGPLTRDALAAALAAHPADILHLTCHGGRHEPDFEFVLEDENRGRAPLPSAKLLELLRNAIDRGGEGRTPFRLVALNVCQALGLRSATDTGAFGLEVLQAGPEAIVGYLFDFGAVSADIFWRTFYATWIRHGQVDHAAQRGRAAVRALRHQALHDFASVCAFTADANGRACPP